MRRQSGNARPMHARPIGKSARPIGPPQVGPPGPIGPPHWGPRGLSKILAPDPWFGATGFNTQVCFDFGHFLGSRRVPPPSGASGTLASPGLSWPVLASPGLSRPLLATPGLSWPVLASPGFSWPFLALLASPSLPWPLLASLLASPGSGPFVWSNRVYKHVYVYVCVYVYV